MDMWASMKFWPERALNVMLKLSIVYIRSGTGWLYRIRQFQNWPQGNEISVKPAVTMAPG